MHELDDEMEVEINIKIVKLTHRTENSQFVIEKKQLTVDKTVNNLHLTTNSVPLC